MVGRVQGYEGLGGAKGFEISDLRGPDPRDWKSLATIVRPTGENGVQGSTDEGLGGAKGFEISDLRGPDPRNWKSLATIVRPTGENGVQN